mmetsp:Transcript_5951/g.17914  ORF Transcript_5951/g.17914 Transcript_5951/m.17914 type:complete len:215 (+) Transcript_5951:959-1603(+)
MGRSDGEASVFFSSATIGKAARESLLPTAEPSPWCPIRVSLAAIGSQSPPKHLPGAETSTSDALFTRRFVQFDAAELSVSLGELDVPHFSTSPPSRACKSVTVLRLCPLGPVALPLVSVLLGFCGRRPARRVELPFMVRKGPLLRDSAFSMRDLSACVTLCRLFPLVAMVLRCSLDSMCPRSASRSVFMICLPSSAAGFSALRAVTGSQPHSFS